MSLWLTRAELEELTGYKTPRKWRQALAQLSIPFLSRPLDGFPLVSRASIETSPKLQSAENRRKPRFHLVRQ